MQTELARLAAFTDTPAGGNPAGVHVADRHPTPDDMQSIAADVGYSETAFLAPHPDEEGRWLTRYFSPAAEVDFCGHATIASAVWLAERFGAGAVTLQTNIGDVAVTTDTVDGQIVAGLTSVTPSTAPLHGELLDLLLATFGWTQDDLDPTYTPAVAFAGVHHPILVLRDRALLSAMTYPFEDLRTLMEREGWTTVQLLHPTGAGTFDARDPFPVGGVVEDPATGAAAAAFGGYLRSHGLVEAPADLTIIQGEDMGRRSVLQVHIPAGDDGIRVSGTAVALG